MRLACSFFLFIGRQPATEAKCNGAEAALNFTLEATSLIMYSIKVAVLKTKYGRYGNKMEFIASINSVVNDFIWGIPAMICIVGVGILLTVRTRFIQVRKFTASIKNTLGKIFSKEIVKDGAISPFQAVCTALAGTVGTGNIAGVAGAIAIGGPGAVFWMWCSAFLGM